MKTTANILLLETKDTTSLFLKENNTKVGTIELLHGKFYHMFLTLPKDSSIDEIKEGDWVYLNNNISELPEYDGNYIIQIKSEEQKLSANIVAEKVVASTDELVDGWDYKKDIPDGDFYNKFLPKIPQPFIDYFIKQYKKGNTLNSVDIELSYKEKPMSDVFLDKEIKILF